MSELLSTNRSVVNMLDMSTKNHRTTPKVWNKENVNACIQSYENELMADQDTRSIACAKAHAILLAEIREEKAQRLKA